LKKIVRRSHHTATAAAVHYLQWDKKDTMPPMNERHFRLLHARRALIAQQQQQREASIENR
jgi:hypothetical protein